jgi:hypothetical protein
VDSDTLLTLPWCFGLTAEPQIQQLNSRSFNVPKFKLFFSFYFVRSFCAVYRLNFAIFIRPQVSGIVKLIIKSN